MLECKGSVELKYEWENCFFMDRIRLVDVPRSIPRYSETEGFPFNAGQYELEFKFELPKNAPPSYDGAKGLVRYEFRLVVMRPYRRLNPPSYVWPFTVQTTLDLNNVPESRLTAERTDSMTFGFWKWKTGPITATVRLPKIGFIPGEQLLFHARIDNQTRKKLKGIRVELIEEAIYSVNFRQSFNHTRVVSCQRKEDSLIGISEWKNEPVIAVPTVVPSSSHIPRDMSDIQISYKLKFVVETGLFSKELVLPIDILIGTVALKGCDPHTSVGVPSSTGINQAEADKQDTKSSITILWGMHCQSGEQLTVAGRRMSLRTFH